MMAKDRDGFNIDTLAIFFADDWLMVLAAPHIYRALQRPVEPTFLIRLLDIWIAYADRGDRYVFPLASDPNRPALARKLRDLISAWTPPELPAEITAAARALLHAEGYEEPPLGAVTWDDFNFDPDRAVESRLAWPETEILLKEADAADVESTSLERKESIAKWLKNMKVSDNK